MKIVKRYTYYSILCIYRFKKTINLFTIVFCFQQQTNYDDGVPVIDVGLNFIMKPSAPATSFA